MFKGRKVDKGPVYCWMCQQSVVIDKARGAHEDDLVGQTQPPDSVREALMWAHSHRHMQSVHGVETDDLKISHLKYLTY